MNPSTRILIGDASKRLRDLPDESVHCVITSPPYWRMRTYGSQDGMIGMEPTFELHVERLIGVFDEVWRVMRPEATLWLNYGDGYANDGKWGGRTGGKQAYTGEQPGRMKTRTGLKPKDLLMMPARLALALQEHGWWLRSEIVWAKTNPMPDTAMDRPSSAHEKIYLFTKQERYFYDEEAVRRHSGEQERDMSVFRSSHDIPLDGAEQTSGRPSAPEPQGGKLRNIWAMPTASYSEAHFATFPTDLAATAIKAGTSGHGACAECGAPFERITERKAYGRWHQHHSRLGEGNTKRGGHKEFEAWEPPRTLGWEASCGCADDRAPCLVLDPFGGAGTVALVSHRLGRSAVLVEISDEYAELARQRLVTDAGMFAAVVIE